MSDYFKRAKDRRARALELRESGHDIRSVAAAMSVGISRASEMIRYAEGERERQGAQDASLVALSRKAFNAIRRAGIAPTRSAVLDNITTLRAGARHRGGILHLGPKTLREIESWLESQ